MSLPMPFLSLFSIHPLIASNHPPALGVTCPISPSHICRGAELDAQSISTKTALFYSSCLNFSSSPAQSLLNSSWCKPFGLKAGFCLTAVSLRAPWPDWLDVVSPSNKTVIDAGTILDYAMWYAGIGDFSLENIGSFSEIAGNLWITQNMRTFMKFSLGNEFKLNPGMDECMDSSNSSLPSVIICGKIWQEWNQFGKTIFVKLKKIYNTKTYKHWQILSWMYELCFHVTKCDWFKIMQSLYNLPEIKTL